MDEQMNRQRGGERADKSPGFPLCHRIAHLSKEGDWLLAHGMSIPNVGTDDLSEWLFDTLGREKATGGD